MSWRAKRYGVHLSEGRRRAAGRALAFGGGVGALAGSRKERKEKRENARTGWARVGGFEPVLGLVGYYVWLIASLNKGLGAPRRIEIEPSQKNGPTSESWLCTT